MLVPKFRRALPVYGWEAVITFVRRHSTIGASSARCACCYPHTPDLASRFTEAKALTTDDTEATGYPGPLPPVWPKASHKVSGEQPAAAAFSCAPRHRLRQSSTHPRRKMIATAKRSTSSTLAC